MDVLLNHITSISPDRAIDVGLNVIGFLAAGALMMVVSSMFQRNRRTEMIDEVAVKPTEASTAAPKEADKPKEQSRSSISFVSFGDKPNRPERTATEKTQRANIAGGRRNRAEVIRLAKEMIDARKSGEEIRKRLPITEAELAMLDTEK